MPGVSPHLYTIYNAEKMPVYNYISIGSEAADKMTSMALTFQGCVTYTGDPICGNNVTDMSYTYENCTNLTEAIIGPNVTNMYGTYCNANISNAYIYSDNIANGEYNSCYCFSKLSNDRVNIYIYIYIYINKSSVNTILKIYATCNNKRDSYEWEHTWIGSKFYSASYRANNTWTNDTTNGIYYNTKYNIYVYAVENVQNIKPYTYEFKYNSITMKNED